MKDLEGTSLTVRVRAHLRNVLDTRICSKEVVGEENRGRRVRGVVGLNRSVSKCVGTADASERRGAKRTVVNASQAWTPDR